MALNWQKVIAASSAGSSPRRAWGFKRCADAMASWLDFQPFDPRVWSDVRRYNWNYTSGTLPFFGEEACGYPIEPTSHVRAREEEEVVVPEDAAFWRNEWDVGALRAYFRVLFPGFREAVGEGDEGIEGLFAGLGRLMGGGGGEARVHVALCVGVGDEAVVGVEDCVVFGPWGVSIIAS